MSIRRHLASSGIGIYRAWLLVQGTTKAKLTPIPGADSAEPEKQSFKVAAMAAKCLLSEEETMINLVGYCGYDEMLSFRLDKDVALVSISAFEGSPRTGIMEHIVKIEKSQIKQAMHNAMAEFSNRQRGRCRTS